MHPALQLEEILFNIFGHCYSANQNSKRRADLAVLARTCHAFKEPALDVLWTEMANLSPLARCLPGASRRIYPGCSWFAFSRPLEQAEWNALRSYTRRIRSIHDFTRGLNWESVKTIFNPPTPDPMFPNLRVLRWEFIKETFSLMRHLLVPSLTSLDINFVFGDVPPFQSFPYPLAQLCPNLRKVWIRMRRSQAASDEYVSGLVRYWSNLRVLFCPYVCFDLEALLHLSRTPALSNLSFTLNEEIVEKITSSGQTLVFSKLRNLEISSGQLDLIASVLPCVRLPSIESLTAYIDCCPSKHALRDYLVGVQKACTLHSLVNLKVIQIRNSDYGDFDSEPSELTFEDLLPCMVFDNLRTLNINTASTVHLTDEHILNLASAWPRLEYLLINEEWGWKSEGGITPAGLFELLQMLPLLHHFSLAIDTRGYTEVPPAVKLALASGFAPRVPFSVNVADSFIQPESVGALAAFFGAIMQRHASVSSWYWSTSAMTGRRDTELMERLWEDVFVKAHEKVQIQYRIT